MITQLLKISFVHAATLIGFVSICVTVIIYHTRKAKPDPEEDVTDITKNFKVFHGGKKKAS